MWNGTMTEMFRSDELLRYNEHHALFIVVVTYWPVLFPET